MAAAKKKPVKKVKVPRKGPRRVARSRAAPPLPLSPTELAAKLMPVEVPVPQTMLGMLTLLRQFFRIAPMSESKKLYDVLSALRGPDFYDTESCDIKLSTTGLIRYKAFGDLLEPHAMVTREDQDKHRDTRRHLNSIFDTNNLLSNDSKIARRRHFIAHAKIAFIALGLNW